MNTNFEVKVQGCCAYIVARDDAGNLEHYSLQDLETGIVTLESKVAFMSVSFLSGATPIRRRSLTNLARDIPK